MNKAAFLFLFVAASFAFTAAAMAQSVTTSPPHALTSPVTCSLGLSGYNFTVLEISGQPVELYADNQYPIIVPLVSTTGSTTTGTTTAPKPLGFSASFQVTNNSSFPRPFQFVDQYYANIKLAFTVFDSNNTPVWQSYQTQVDIPPLATPVTDNLAAHSSWQKNIFVPLQQALTVLKPGNYTLQADVLGSPGYSASAPFTVSVIVGGPIIGPKVPITPVQ